MYPSVDRSVIEAAQGGDRDAFAEIYRVFYCFVLKLATKTLRDPMSVGNAYIEHRRGCDLAGAEDVAQDTFVVLLRKFHLYDPGRPLAPWIATIVMNLCRNRINRRAKGERSLECMQRDDGDAVDDDRKKELIDARAFCDPPRLWESAEIRECVATALEAVTPRRRRVLTLRLIEELDWDEIAAQMQITKPAAQSLLYYGIQQMRQALQAAGAKAQHEASH